VASALVGRIQTVICVSALARRARAGQRAHQGRVFQHQTLHETLPPLHGLLITAGG